MEGRTLGRLLMFPGIIGALLMHIISRNVDIMHTVQWFAAWFRVFEVDVDL